MKKLILAILPLCSIFLPYPALAKDSSLDLKILPMNCVFETVNDGSNAIHYLTPADCGQVIEVPGVNLPITQDNPGAPLLVVPLARNPVLQADIQADPPVPGPIVLNSLAAYSGSGVPLTMSQGQTVHFEVAMDDAKERHSITLKQIGPNFVIITIASTPFDTKLFVGETKRYDVTKDNKEDIQVSLASIENGVVHLIFKQVGQPLAQFALQSKTPPRQSIVATIVAGLLAIGVVPVIIVRQRRLKNGRKTNDTMG